MVDNTTPKMDKKVESSYALLKELCTKLMDTKNIKVNKEELKKKVDGATKAFSDMYKSVYVVAKCPAPLEPQALPDKASKEQIAIHEQQTASYNMYLKLKNASEGASTEQLKMKGLIYGAAEALSDVLPAEYIAEFKKRIIEE